MNTAIIITTLGMTYAAGCLLAYLGCMVWALDRHLDGFEEQLRTMRRRRKRWPLAQLCGHCVLFIAWWPIAAAIVAYHVVRDWWWRHAE